MTDTSGPTSRSGDSTVKGDPRRHLQVKVDVEGLPPSRIENLSRGADLPRERPVPRVPGEPCISLSNTGWTPGKHPCSGRCPVASALVLYLSQRILWVVVCTKVCPVWTTSCGATGPEDARWCGCVPHRVCHITVSDYSARSESGHMEENRKEIDNYG